MKVNSQTIGGWILVLLLAIIETGLQAQSTVHPDAAAGISLESTPAEEPLTMNATDMGAVKTLSEAQLAAFIKALDVTPLISFEAQPENDVATFYSLQHPEWPPLPCNTSQSPVWPMNDFNLLDDVGFDYQAASTAAWSARRQMQTMSLDGPPAPGDGGTNEADPYLPQGLPVPDYGSNLWIAQFSLTNGSVTGIASNTLPNICYELEYLTNLVQGNIQSNWLSTGWFIFGSETTNWTSLGILPVDLTSRLFLRLRSDASSDGSSLSDWWEQEYGVTDPYGDPDGDGWNNLQEFQRGTSPLAFDTPPAPQGLTVSYHSVSGTTTLNWLPAPGPVTGYTVTDSDGHTHDVASTTFTESVPYAPDFSYGTVGDPTLHKSYQVQARYGGNSSASSAPVPLQPATVWGKLVPAPAGQNFLEVGGVPPGTAKVRVFMFYRGTYYADNSEYPFTVTTNVDIPVENFTNGLCPASTNWLNLAVFPPYPIGYEEHFFYLQAVDAGGNVSGGSSLLADWKPDAFYDGRVQLKQNLAFLLRAATPTAPFWFREMADVYTVAALVTNTPDYAYASFYDANRYNLGTYNGLPWVEYEPQVNAARPFADNHLYRNFVYSPADVDASGRLATGVAGDDGWAGDDLRLYDPPKYVLPAASPPDTTALLAANQTRWLATYGVDSDWWSAGDLGISSFIDGGNYFLTMMAGIRNLFGLPLLSAKVVWGDDSGANATLSPAANVENADGYYYPETAPPQLQTVEYDFWTMPADYYVGGPTASGIAFPETPGFSPTNTSQSLFFMPVGSQTQIAGYAKLAVLNGYAGVYAYLGQYFDQAYQVDTNGGVTTNLTGVLSPYGSFFATEPGQAALVTMPDPDTGERGTGVVHCVSLQVDKNHDGEMDGGFNGPDATSPASPMVCWVNNGYIKPGSNGSLDQDLSLPLNDLKNANYSQGKITCQRDLENFFRLWIRGVPQLPSAQGYTVTFSLTALRGDPAVNLYLSSDSAGGTGYLTDTNVAAEQARTEMSPNPEFGVALATINGQQSYTLPANFFDYNYPYYSRFLFEGAGIGLGQLTLTISQNSNVIVQASAYLDLHDVKDLYEQAHADNVTSSLPPSSLISQCKIDHETVIAPDETKQIVVFVHGINNSAQDYYDSTDVIFKRLYWSGYHGKVAGFRWPCAYLPPDHVVNPIDYLKALNYNKGEFYAWKSASALKDYLSYLTNRLAGYQIDILAHSQGNIVASEAIKQGAPFDNFILTQAAVPADCYDTSVPFQQKFLDAESNSATPLYTTNGGYHGYFANLSGNIINFYNTNDYALRTGTKTFVGFVTVDANWEANEISRKPEDFTYMLGQSYGFFPSSFRNIAFYTFSQYDVTDPQEIMSMVARSRTHALGAQDNVGGAINASVDLVGTFQFGRTRDDHSAEFKWPIQRIWGYYDQMLASFNIQHIAR